MSRSRWEEISTRDLAGVANLAHQLQHAHTRFRIKAVGGLIEQHQPRPVGDGLRQLGQLLHPQRVGPQLAIPRFTQANVEESFVGALHGFTAGQAGKLGHVADEADAAHIGDEGVALRHVADHGAEFAQVALDFFSENAGRACNRFVKPQQSIDQGRFARSVRPQQADTTA